MDTLDPGSALSGALRHPDVAVSEERTTADSPTALFVPSFRGGGAERVMIDIANGLAQRGRRIQFVVCSSAGPYRDQLLPQVQVVDLGTGRVSRSIVPLARYLRRERPQAIFATMEHANLAAVIAHTLARSPSRLVLRTATTIKSVPLTFSSARSWLAYKLIPSMYRRASALVAPSAGAATAMTMLVTPKFEVKVIPNPIDVDNIHKLAQVRPDGAPWWHGERTILAVGSLLPVKDHQLLIRAFARVQAATQTKLVILGEGPSRAELETLADSLGVGAHVALPGFVDNPFWFMRQCALFVLTSKTEGSPNALLQALACGVRTISTDCESGPREILADGKWGTLVPVGDIDALSEAIQANILNPAMRPSPDVLAPYAPAAIFATYDHLLHGPITTR